MSNYHVWIFLGLAETEAAKIYREPQWQRCFSLVDPLFRPYGKRTAVIPNLAFEVPLASRRQDPPGTRRVNYKKVPTGRLKWNESDHQRLTDWFATPHEFPVVQIETRVLSDARPERVPEVMLRIVNRDASPTSLYNQVLILAVAEGHCSEHSSAAWDALIQGIGDLVRAARIAHCVRPFSMTASRGGYTVLSSLMSESFTLRHDTLDLDDTWQHWELIR